MGAAPNPFKIGDLVTLKGYEAREGSVRSQSFVDRSEHFGPLMVVVTQATGTHDRPANEGHTLFRDAPLLFIWADYMDDTGVIRRWSGPWQALKEVPHE